MLRSEKIRHMLLYALSVILVISNLGIISNNQLRKGILYLAFGLLLLIYIAKSGWHIQRKFFSLFIVSLFIVLYLIFVKNFSLLSDRVIFMIMDIGMIWIGIGITKYEDSTFINRLFCSYVITCVISGIYYLLMFDTSIIYGYELKHCLASNILMAFIIVIMGYARMPKIIIVASLFVLLIAIFNLNSRSTIISFIGMIVLMVIVERKNIVDFFSRKRYFGILIISIPILLIMFGKIVDKFKIALRLDTLATIDISRYSADRIPMIIQGLEYLKKNEILGIANLNIAPSNFYIECFPLDILVQIGVVGFILYCIWFVIIGMNYLGKRAFLDDRNLARVVLFALCLIGLFSANAPMGPGSAYSFGWLIVGIYWLHNDKM